MAKKRSPKKASKRLAEELKQAADDEPSELERLLSITEDQKATIRRLESRMRRQQGLTEALLERVERCMESVTKPRMPRLPKTSPRGREEIGVLLLSDFQIGALGSGNHGQEFSTQIARERVMERLLPKLAKVVEQRRAGATMDKLFMLCLGDNVDGSGMRANHAWSVDSPVDVQALNGYPELMRDLTLGLMQLFPKIEAHCVYGNHGRSGPKRQDPNPARVNWDSVASFTWRLLMGDLVDGERLSIHVERERPMYEVEIGKSRVLLAHGDQWSGGGMVGLPLMAIYRSIARMVSSELFNPDMLVMGHFHQEAANAFGRVQIRVNGSLQTGSGYVSNFLHTQSIPSQRFMVFDPDRGVIADSVLALED